MTKKFEVTVQCTVTQDAESEEDALRRVHHYDGLVSFAKNAGRNWTAVSAKEMTQ